MTEPQEIDVDELAARLDGGAIVIDVREADEYESGHVPGARFLPLSELQNRSGEVPADEPVLIICKSGGRSMRACQFLAPLGHDVTNVAGGTMAWVDSGREVVTGIAGG